jgi:hypothetical protein
MRRAPQIGMIGNESVSLMDIRRRIAPQHSFGAGGEGAHVKGQDHVLGDDFTLAVQDSAAGVLGFPDDGGEAGAEERVLHLLDDAGQARLDHL